MVSRNAYRIKNITNTAFVDICCQITLNLKFIIVLVTICMNLISWQTAITAIYKHPVDRLIEPDT
jgi:hypothetical protein